VAAKKVNLPLDDLPIQPMIGNKFELEEAQEIQQVALKSPRKLRPR
jgi:hypothetical protein